MKHPYINLFLAGTLFIIFQFQGNAQVAIGTTGTTPAVNSKAVLLLVGNNSQGLIIPIVTNKSAVNPTPAEKGMVVFDDSDKKVYYYNGTPAGWIDLGGGAGGSQSISIAGNLIQLSGSPASSFPLASASGPSANRDGQLLMWNQTSARWEATANTPIANGMVLTWNSTTNTWEPKAPGSASPIVLNAGQIFVGNVSNVATATAPASFSLSNFGVPTADVPFGNRKITGLATPTAGTDAATKAYVDANVLPSLSASQLLSNNGSNVGINVGGDLGLAVSGTAGTFTIQPNAITTTKISNGAVTVAKIGTAGVPDANKVLSTDASGVPAWTTSTGITNFTVTTINPLATYLFGSVAGSTAALNFKAIVNNDIDPVANISGTKLQDGSVTIAKLVTAGATDANKILTTNATGVPQWTIAAGGGDMLKSTYDPTNINGSAFTLANHTGQITTAQITDASVTDIKLATGISAAKITGILPVAQIPTLPVSRIAFSSSNGDVLTTVGGATVWQAPSGTTYLAGTGLTLTGNSFSVNASQNISTLSNLSSNGLIKTSGGTGALSIATGADLPAMTATTGGAVPTPPNNTTTFLRGDGTFATPAGAGIVTNVSVVTANGFSGTVATPTSTPAITLGTSLTGILKGNGTALSAALAGTDYLGPFASQTANFIYAAPSGIAGVPIFRAVNALDIPTLNQNTTGSAASFTGALGGDVTGTQGATVIANSAITDAKVATGISGSKIVPSFGTQNISTTGTLTTGNVGIGTTAPNAPLHISTGQPDGRKIILFEQANNGNQYIGFGVGGLGTFESQIPVNSNAFLWKVGTSASTSNELMRITGVGNVGIGTSTPINRLDVEGGMAIGATYSGTNSAPSNGAIVEGNVGIGTNNPSERLHIKEDADSFIGLVIENTNTGTISTERIWFNDENGSVAGIQVGDPTNGLGSVMSIFNNRPSSSMRLSVAGAARLTIANNGNISIPGSLTKGSGTFKIDHPQDPENKYLYHSFVESPDMMNVYNGNIKTDSNGQAVVELPSYFESLNKDFRYQLTVMGEFAQAIVFKEVDNNQFTIKTDKPNVKVSWQVTGIRKDPFAEKNRVVPEVEKTGTEKGKYLHPEAYGLPTDRGVNYEPKKDYN